MASRLTLHVIELFAVSVIFLGSYLVNAIILGLFIGAENAVMPAFYLTIGVAVLLSVGTFLRNWWHFRDAPVSAEEAERAHAIVEEMADRMGMKKPAVGIDTESTAWNAYATYILPTRPLVVFTEPMLRADDEILRAVAAHELSHIKSRDMYLTTLLTYIETGIESAERFFKALATDSLTGAVFFGPLYVTALAMTTLNTVLFFVVSRTREYKADYDAAAVTSPETMVRTLQFLHAGAKDDDVGPKSLIQTIPREVSDALFSTHPSVEDRIKNVRKHAKQTAKD